MLSEIDHAFVFVYFSHFPCGEPLRAASRKISAWPAKNPDGDEGLCPFMKSCNFCMTKPKS
jgi:hypothetical protein